jgi:hypothetical protein
VVSADTHIRCRFCGHWCGNVGHDGIPIGWRERYDRSADDPARVVIAWVDEHICNDGRKVRLVAPAGKPLQGKVRLTPQPIG